MQQRKELRAFRDLMNRTMPGWQECLINDARDRSEAAGHGRDGWRSVELQVELMTGEVLRLTLLVNPVRLEQVPGPSDE